MENKCSDASLCFCSVLLLLGPAFFFSIFIYSNLPSAMPSAMPSALPSALPSARRPICQAGVLTVFQKNPNIISSPQKFPPFFQKLHPTSPHLTPHILRTVSQYT